MDHTIIALRKQDFKSVCMWLGIANKMREEEKKRIIIINIKIKYM